MMGKGILWKFTCYDGDFVGEAEGWHFMNRWERGMGFVFVC